MGLCLYIHRILGKDYFLRDVKYKRLHLGDVIWKLPCDEKLSEIDWLFIRLSTSGTCDVNHDLLFLQNQAHPGVSNRKTGFVNSLGNEN